MPGRSWIIGPKSVQNCDFERAGADSIAQNACLLSMMVALVHEMRVDHPIRAKLRFDCAGVDPVCWSQPCVPVFVARWCLSRAGAFMCCCVEVLAILFVPHRRGFGAGSFVCLGGAVTLVV